MKSMKSMKGGLGEKGCVEPRKIVRLEGAPP
jgi:hypothetical protein